ncbi:MAG: GNAT family N-acetyltransferase [Oscillospiraceae bacterium]|nr:GNAT family N-acetyltransferase [Oscillospiraceae bacterium]
MAFCIFCGHGLAYIAAREMVRRCLNNGKKPVWVCHSESAASDLFALKLGFRKTAECFTVTTTEK